MMSVNKKIKGFNLNLVRNNVYHDINTYYKLVSQNFFKHIDLTLTDYLYSLIENNEMFLINSIKLVEFGIFDNLENILLYMEINNLRVNHDYIIRESNSENTNQIIHDYILTPDSFKLCALSSPKTSKYRDYYLLFEKIHYFYSHYNSLFRIKLTNTEEPQNKQILDEILNIKHILNGANKKRKIN